MRCDHLVIHSFGVECVTLSLLWLMWFVGTAIATVSNLLHVRVNRILTDKHTQSTWGNLGWCQQYSPCRLLTALVAITWIGWVLLLLLLGVTLAHTFINRAWTDPMHGRFYPRKFVPAQTSEYR